MDPLDEADAFARLQEQGTGVEDIARRFGATVRHVEQRLALVTLSPKLRLAWKKRELTLDAARAFCLVDDHGRQDAVFKSMGKPVTQAGAVRSRLMEDHMRASDRLVRYVGLESYEAAGGAVRRDLFDADAVFVEDPGLVAKLAEEKLTATIPEWTEKGWGWVEACLDGSRPEGLAPLRLQPVWRDATDTEEVQLQQLQEKIDALDSALDESSVEDDPRWADRDDLEAAYETIRQAARTWDDELMKHAGVLLAIGHSGDVVVTEGVIRKDDQKLIDAIRRKRETGHDVGDATAPTDNPPGPSIPKALARDLTAIRTAAIRSGVASEPDIALALCVAALSARLLRRQTLSGIDISAGMSSNTTDDVAIGTLDSRLPEEPRAILAWCLAQDAASLLSHLAILVASTVDLSHEDACPADTQRQAVSDELAAVLRLDMTTVWSPDAEYWMRMPKALLLQELQEATESRGLSPSAQSKLLQECGKMKKDALAQRVDEAWRGKGYLPELLVTPLSAGSIVLTHGVAVAAE